MSTETQFDLVIVGAGPGGYVAAVRAAQLGMKVAVVEKRSTPGGVCLNEGCIPSKALLDSSERFSAAADSFARHGIVIPAPELDLPVMMRRKEDIVRKLTDGIAHLFRKNGITRLQGTARLVRGEGQGGYAVSVTLAGTAAEAGQQSLLEAQGGVILLQAPRILLAAGGEAVSLPGVPFDGQVVVSAREALSFDRVPEHLIVIGGGYIGLELGSVWRRLGAEVTVMEMLPQILPAMDRQAADALYRLLRRQGIRFHLGTRIYGVRRIGNRAIVAYNTGTGVEEVDCDRVLVAAGRRPCLDGLGLEDSGIQLDERGRVAVDDAFQTSLPGVYAVGDLIAGPMLAHKASDEGVACVERMAGLPAQVAYDRIPGVCYTRPEAAAVGRTEEELKQGEVPYRAGRFNFSANGRARCVDEGDGFVKILAHAETDLLLGVHIVGPHASELIAEAVAVMAAGGTARDIARACHAHPTLSEALREAALDVHGEAIHA